MSLTEEELGELAYRTYYKNLGLSPDLWDTELPDIQQTWLKVAKVIAERVLQQQQIAVETSE